MRRAANYYQSWLLGAVAVATPGCFLEDWFGGGPQPPVHDTVELSTGIEMAYHELGDPDGDVVIFLHGYTDTSRSFMPTATALLDLDDDFHVFVLDQRGHGGSSMPPAADCAAAPEDCFAPADMAADVIAFMDAKGIDHAAIVGHSMGSFVAQELGLSHPQRVDKLVLIGTAAGVAGNVVLQDYILAEPVEGSWKDGFVAQGLDFPEDVYALDPLDADADAQAWIEGAWVVDPAADPDFVAAIVPETAATRMGTWIGVARALLQTDNTARLQDLEVPTLILWATQDGFFYDDPHQQALRAALDVAVDACKLEYWFKQYGKRPLGPDGVQIDDIGHNTQWATPDEVARDLKSYLNTGKPTRDWYYSADGDPQDIVTEEDAAPLIHGECD
ncbi:alpha/beta fold hydrolase [Nannocystis radixulma]|uniref:Alpha/beta hydrolase n=1 Tax=Nannocystis radixulma TaxID=2995305 RepID=A0ABT5B0K5_9BACT|nr:alpha/beta hydrolase [Nannocystis radixulma]MDC0667064.1 alpha/beta hydrolase [Nannocystis radixulma]